MSNSSAELKLQDTWWIRESHALTASDEYDTEEPNFKFLKTHKGQMCVNVNYLDSVYSEIDFCRNVMVLVGFHVLGILLCNVFV